MNIHFIAIGGAIMHNLALSLRMQGHNVTGSDDEIFEPAFSNLKNAGLLPKEMGWHPNKLLNDIDEVILGMHAKADNPELVLAQQLGLKIFSFPDYVYEKTKSKMRVVVGGSHGKSTVTSMIMHVLRLNFISFDYLVGAQLEHFDLMVNFEENNKLAIIEGDEYLSSTLQPIPKFHLYRPHIAVIIGIAWDHINVFPTFEDYVSQFEKFISTIQNGGLLIFNQSDVALTHLVKNRTNSNLTTKAVSLPDYEIDLDKACIKHEGKKYPVEVFGKHNFLNIKCAWEVCRELGITDKQFLHSISSFKGASKRLELIYRDNKRIIFKDFAHSPSKVKAAIDAVKEMFSKMRIIAVLELHTYSSLNIAFLSQYNGVMDKADVPVVFYNEHAIKSKNMNELNAEDVKAAFHNDKIFVIKEVALLTSFLSERFNEPAVLLLMSSGTFGNLDLKQVY